MTLLIHHGPSPVSSLDYQIIVQAFVLEMECALLLGVNVIKGIPHQCVYQQLTGPPLLLMISVILKLI